MEKNVDYLTKDGMHHPKEWYEQFPPFECRQNDSFCGWKITQRRKVKSDISFQAHMKIFASPSVCIF